MSNVLFDFDGTLFDTYEGISVCANYALEKLKREPLEESELRKFLGPPIFASFKEFAGLEDELIDEAVHLFRERYVDGGLYMCRPYEGLPELLREWKKSGFKLCIASSKPQFAIELLLEKFGMSDLFARICGASGAERNADKSEKVRSARMEENAVMVGDRRFDIEAAKKVGLKAVGACYGFGSKEELLQAGADRLAYNAAELKTAVEELITDKKRGF